MIKNVNIANDLYHITVSLSLKPLFLHINMHDARGKLEKEEEIPFKNLRHTFSEELAWKLIAKRLVELDNVENKRGLLCVIKSINNKAFI